MAKTTIVRTWIAGLVVFAAGLVVVGVSIGLMLAYGGHFTSAPSGNGYDFVPAFDSPFWTTVTFMVLGGIVAAAGGLVQLVAWVGALVNTNRLPDKTWFVVLLLGGLVGVAFAPVGFAAMLAYVMAGPDGMAVNAQQPHAPESHPAALVPTA